MTYKIVVHNVSKEFSLKNSRLKVLDDVSFGIADTEFCCLLGPSACGKSTLLLMMAGLEKPSGGYISIDGKQVMGPGPDKGVVFQDYLLLPWLTVYENVVFGPKLRGIRKEFYEKRARRIIELVGLMGFENSYPHQLSGGMQQRVALARTLVNNPEVLLMDEPFASVDAQTRSLLQSDLLEIWEKERKTVVFVTHDIDEALILSDKIVLFTSRPGKVKKIIVNNLERPREITSLQFNQMKREILNLLWEEIKNRPISR